MPVDWTVVGETLVTNYLSNESGVHTKYFNHFEFEEDEPLAAVVPLATLDKFFGTVVQNLLIISKPFGWSGVDGGDKGTFHWPPPGLDDSIARLVAGFKYFAYYETLVWMDMSSDGSECPDPSAWTEMMNATKGSIMSMCDDLHDFGFTYMGEITDSDIDPIAFFTPYSDPHFKRLVP